MRLWIHPLASVSAFDNKADVAIDRAHSFKLRSLPALVALAVSTSAMAAPPLPQGGQFVAGKGSIAQDGANLNITQTGSRGIIDWNSFSIGAGRTVTINNGAGATLNRVTGNDMSSIMGTLKGTGSVYLINPHGVLVGPTGVVATGGRFVASTLDMKNDEFMNNPGYLEPKGDSKADVVNLGKISSTGGDVFLLSAHNIVNAGSIDAPNGSVELANGHDIVLMDTGYGQQVSVSAPSGGTVINAGTVQAAMINLQAADGNIFALAGKSSALRATGTATRDGHVYLVASGGTVDASGATIAAHNADGSGATVDTIANTVRMNGASVTAKQWNIDTSDFNASALTTATLASNLSKGTSIAVNAQGTQGKGDISLQSGLRWIGASTLSLNAKHTVWIAPGATIANTGAGNLSLHADANGANNGGSVLNRGTIDWSGSTGIVSALYDMNGSYAPGTVRTNASWSAAPFSGLVTQVTAYQLVNSAADLGRVKSNLAGNYALGQSFDVGSATDVGNIGSAANPFTGQFDGMGHLLSGVNVTGSASTGLFGVIGKTGVVRNFIADSGLAQASTGPVGLIAGTNDGAIVNVGSTGSVTKNTGATTAAGGLVGLNRGRIEGSWSGASVNGIGRLGGLVGQNDGSIDTSYTINLVSASGAAGVGGLAGVNTGSIARSYAAGFVSGGTDLGGLVGNNTGTIRQSYSFVTFIPGDKSNAPGGIAGVNNGTIGNDVFWNSDISGATAGVTTGKRTPASAGLTSAQMTNPASYGPTWDFSAKGVWQLQQGDEAPVFRTLAGS
jgi:filamentous hemagglutinin family protein